MASAVYKPGVNCLSVKFETPRPENLQALNNGEVVMLVHESLLQRQ